MSNEKWSRHMRLMFKSNAISFGGGDFIRPPPNSLIIVEKKKKNVSNYCFRDNLFEICFIS